VVYVREAHALDGFLPRGGGFDPIVEDPRTSAERQRVASRCVEALSLAPIPVLVDTIDDHAGRAYDAWPDRLYLIGRDGRVAYQGAPGPDGFAPDELEAAIADELGLEAPSTPAAARPRVSEPTPSRANDSRRVAIGAYGPEPTRVEIESWWRSQRGFVPSPDPAASRAWVRAKDVAAIEDGSVPIDLDWIPDERAPSARRAQGLFPCGEEWLPEPLANDYHSRLPPHWWRIPGRHFNAYATCDRGLAEAALSTVDEETYPDLVRLFGVEPALPPTVIVLRSLVQYNAFGVLRPDGDAVPPDASGFSAVHHSFLCERWLDAEHGFEYPGAGCTYWDDDTEAGRRWGPLAVRHAAAQAFVESIDPPIRAIDGLRDAPRAPFDADAAWRERRIPLWLRYGASMYCERFFIATNVEDPDWARRWSFAVVAERGGLGALDELFASSPDQNDPGRSQEWMLQAGLVVAFVLDGDVPAITERHDALRQALRAGRGVRAAVLALEDELAGRRAEIEAFAGL
jgi:hypothetical protein